MIIDNTGAYTSASPQFETVKGLFTLISTESSSEEETWEQSKGRWQNRALGNTLDTYINKNTGDYFTWSRKQIWKWDQEGILKTVQH